MGTPARAIDKIETATINKGISWGMETRQSPELIFALIEPLGGGADKVVEYIIKELQQPPYNYHVKLLS